MKIILQVLGSAILTGVALSLGLGTLILMFRLGCMILGVESWM